MFIKRNWKKLVLFVPIVLFRKIDVIFYDLKIDMPVAELFIQNMFSGNPDRQQTHLTIVMFGMVEIVLFSLLFGMYIYKDLFGSGVYIIIRQTNRTKWFIQRCTELFISAVLFAIITAGMTFIISASCSKYGNYYTSIKIFLLTTVLSALFAFWQTLTINLTAIRFESTIGFIANYITLTFLSLLAVSHEKIPIIKNFPLLLRLNPVSNVTINWASEWGETLAPVLYFAVLIILTIFIGVRKINRLDISLQNNESAA
ncbi:MAG: hypothetical protein LBL15_02400 [Oscillospiraceae bacterium]|jgi:heme/copper-type cytochrome/quinol oxidase subunit 3|nr:hypothetical protein [Oscillospiraceae bacterium]